MSTTTRRRWPTTATCRGCGTTARRWSGKVDRREDLRYVCMACPDRPRLLDADGRAVRQ